MQPSLSVTAFSGAPPRRTKQASAAAQKSAVVREKVKQVARAAECGSVATRPKASRWASLPTGTR